MALKIGGTTVINDSRALENISNLKTVGGTTILGTGDIPFPSSAPVSHIGATGAAHGNATTTVAGFMSATDKTKLNSIPAQVMSIDQYLTQDGNVNFASVTATNLQANDQVTCVNLNVNNIYGFDSLNSLSWVLWGADAAYGFRTTFSNSSQYDLKKTTNGALEIKVDDINRQVLHDGSVKTINGQSIVGSGDLVLATPSTFATDITINGLRLGRGTNINAYFNTFLGEDALLGGSGSSNTAVGWSALKSNTNGSSNTAYGSSSLSSNTQGLCNVAIGNSALNSNITGSYNTASGQSAMLNNQTGQSNSAFGAYALLNNINSSGNTAIGHSSLKLNVGGTSNTSVGASSMSQNTSGSFNTAIGLDALGMCTTGSYNIAIGTPWSSNGQPSPVFNITTENNRVVMGTTSVTNAYIQVAWTVVSDARDKTNFASVPHGLDFVKKLNPISYQFRTSRESNETNGGIRYGFKAQDIAAIEPEGVIIDSSDSEKLRYNESNLIPILVKAIQELTAEVERLKVKVG